MEDTFKQFLKGLYAREWVVYCKPPFNGPETVIAYLGRYTHRVAITNHRIISINEGNVSFLWKDYAAGNRRKVMKLDAFGGTGRKCKRQRSEEQQYHL